MEILTREGCEKTKPIKSQYYRSEFDVLGAAKTDLKKQSQFRYPASSFVLYQHNPKLFHGLYCRKGYTAVYVKTEFYEFWEVNHEKQ